jgi:hypothetical protein
MSETDGGLPDVRTWLVTVDMGYGHQRAAYPLERVARGGVINANDNPLMSEYDRQVFHDLERFHTSFSRFKQVPILGPLVFRIYDRVQAIPPFDPRKDLSRPTLQVRGATRLIRRRNWGRSLVESLWAREHLPFLTTFFSTAHMADLHGYPGPVYCVICDADCSRDWVAKDPRRSRIFYFAPTPRVCERLKLYGVPPERILLTGFPLPEENLGYPGFDILRADTAFRLAKLDPERRFLGPNAEQVLAALAPDRLAERPPRPLTILFAVGGAGAQAEIGLQAASLLAGHIRQGDVRLVLVAGVSDRVREIFREGLAATGLQELEGRGLEILYESEKQRYFQRFNQALRETDILWTKPSELSFYTALGLPVLMAPPIGSQEVFNREWLLGLEAGIDQGDMREFEGWFFELLASGAFARAAFNGFSRAPRLGTYNIIRRLAQPA